MLLSFRDSLFEVESFCTEQSFLLAQTLFRPTNFKLAIMGIYGPTDQSRSRVFLEEITSKIATISLPLVVGDDFNLIRSTEDKNNDRINWSRMDLFNDHIATWGLRELPRTEVRFTWTNKQLNQVRSMLDRAFISPNFESDFPLCSLVAETSLGSDHTPLILDSGVGFPIRSNRFFFELGWFEVPHFHEILTAA
jgi:hypothetical protein